MKSYSAPVLLELIIISGSHKPISPFSNPAAITPLGLSGDLTYPHANLLNLLETVTVAIGNKSISSSGKPKKLEVELIEGDEIDWVKGDHNSNKESEEKLASNAPETVPVANNGVEIESGLHCNNAVRGIDIIILFV